MSIAMWVQSAWAVFLLAFAFVCYFGVRRDRTGWGAPAAAAAGLVLALWGGGSAWELLRQWSGYQPSHSRFGVELVPSIVLVCAKMGVWLGK